VGESKGRYLASSGSSPTRRPTSRCSGPAFGRPLIGKTLCAHGFAAGRRWPYRRANRVGMHDILGELDRQAYGLAIIP
jgi:hypothetical protein